MRPPTSVSERTDYPNDAYNPEAGHRNLTFDSPP
jgi:hypothetical protein